MLKSAPSIRGAICYSCLCDCGKETIVDAHRLSSGNTKSCGCLKRELTSKRHLKDLTGNKYGRLTVLELSHRDKHKQIHYLCLCDCGNKAIVNGNSMKQQHAKSCGCLHAETARLNRWKDLTGKKFGRLLVLKERSDLPRETTDSLWECQCECGKTGIWKTQALTTHNTRSCGCYVSDLARMMMQNPEFQRNALMKTQQRALGL